MEPGVARRGNTAFAGTIASIFAGIIGGWLAGRWLWGVACAFLVLVAVAAVAAAIESGRARSADSPGHARSAEPSGQRIVSALMGHNAAISNLVFAAGNVDQSQTTNVESRTTNFRGGAFGVVLAFVALVGTVGGTWHFAHHTSGQVAGSGPDSTGPLTGYVPVAPRQTQRPAGGTDPSPPSSPALHLGVNFTASDSGGDRITGAMSFGPAATAAESSISPSEFADCTNNQGIPSRTVVAPMRITITGSSSMSDDVTVIPGVNYDMGYITHLSNGLDCSDPEGLSYKITLISGETNTITIWLIYPNITTPNRPFPSPGQLGHNYLQPTIFLSGGRASIRLSGPRVSHCPYFHGDIVPAGSMKCSNL